MAIVALDGTIEFINRKAVDTFGYRPEDIPQTAGGSWPIRTRPTATKSSPCWVALVEKAIAENHEIEPGQYRIACKDGSVKIMEIFGVPVSGKVFVMFDDVTSARGGGGAGPARARLPPAHHRVDSGRVLPDQPGRQVPSVNRNFETVTGHDAQAMAGAHPLDFFDGTDKDLIARRIGAVFESGSATAEAPFRTADGTMRPYFFTGGTDHPRGRQPGPGRGRLRYLRCRSGPRRPWPASRPSCRPPWWTRASAWSMPISTCRRSTSASTSCSTCRNRWPLMAPPSPISP